MTSVFSGQNGCHISRPLKASAFAISVFFQLSQACLSWLVYVLTTTCRDSSNSESLHECINHSHVPRDFCFHGILDSVTFRQNDAISLQMRSHARTHAHTYAHPYFEGFHHDWFCSSHLALPWKGPCIYKMCMDVRISPGVLLIIVVKQIYLHSCLCIWVDSWFWPPCLGFNSAPLLLSLLETFLIQDWLHYSYF